LPALGKGWECAGLPLAPAASELIICRDLSGRRLLVFLMLLLMGLAWRAWQLFGYALPWMIVAGLAVTAWILFYRSYRSWPIFAVASGCVAIVALYPALLAPLLPLADPVFDPSTARSALPRLARLIDSLQ
jgi:hypothetical protein